jgi:triacylglycerol lipase
MLDTRATTLFPESRRPYTGRPVLLVHGLFATPRDVALLAARLRRSGHEARCVDLGALLGRLDTRTIEELALVLADRVEELAWDRPGERIDVVGHSQGGLVARYYVQKLDGARHVRHLVTLGTPHRGTPWARTGHVLGRLLPTVRQMAPGSALLEELAHDAFPPRVRLTSIYSRWDLCCPPSACRLDPAHGLHLRNVELAHGGHLELLSSSRIAALVDRALRAVDRAASEPRRRPVGWAARAA